MSNGNDIDSKGIAVTPTDKSEARSSAWSQSDATDDNESFEVLCERLSQRLAEQHGETICECRIPVTRKFVKSNGGPFSLGMKMKFCLASSFLTRAIQFVFSERGISTASERMAC